MATVMLEVPPVMTTLMPLNRTPYSPAIFDIFL